MTAIEKYQYLSTLRKSNVDLFYRLVAENVTVQQLSLCLSQKLKVDADPEKELTPLIYTPVVGEACLKWSEIYQHPEGRLSKSDQA